jgi:hypothetical protein
MVVKKYDTIDPLCTLRPKRRAERLRIIKKIQPISVGVRVKAMFKEQWSKDRNAHIDRREVIINFVYMSGH